VTQCPALHCELSAQGCPTAPSVQKLLNASPAHTPLLQGASAPQGSPIAPDVHLPEELAPAQERPVAHCSSAEQVLPLLPLVQMPAVEPT
jgi:hypothetical protein